MPIFMQDQIVYNQIRLLILNILFTGRVATYNFEIYFSVILHFVSRWEHVFPKCSMDVLLEYTVQLAG